MRDYFNKCTIAALGTNNLSFSPDVLRIAADEYLPYVQVQERDGLVELCGPMANLLDILSTSLSFEYKVFIPPDRKWGRNMPNGSWNGMIGMLERKVWATLVLTLVLVMLTDAVLNVYDGHHKSFTVHLRNSLWNFVRAMLLQGTSPSPVRLWSKFLHSSWWLAVLVLITAFGGQLSALLLLKKSTVLINSLEDLVEARDITPLIGQGSSFHELIQSSSEGSLHEKLLRRVQNENGFVLVSDTTSDFVLDLIEKGKHALLMSTFNIQYALSRRVAATGRCNFNIIEDSIYSKPYAVALRKGLNRTVVRKLNEKISFVVDNGLFQKWNKEMFRNYNNCLMPAGDYVNQLKIQNFTGVIILLLAGFLLSTLVFVSEKLGYC
ncbi:glutamate receptor ionotropic, delta-1-like isoform X3 [Tachypleus tridentatus]|uniref:glutamate receptor ionotropic, delta-1-like isoform X3 n=1 Tax=Tachypleus tridentatus TaxID=6853 RepID=UPI003FD546A7